VNFDRVRLSNFKPYGDADLRLTEGVTVIHGLNGSGKSRFWRPVSSRSTGRRRSTALSET